VVRGLASNVRRSLMATSNTVASVRVGHRVYLSDAPVFASDSRLTAGKSLQRLCLSEGYLYLPNWSMEVLLPISSAEEIL
jgi:hypothetical protein